MAEYHFGVEVSCVHKALSSIRPLPLSDHSQADVKQGLVSFVGLGMRKRADYGPLVKKVKVYWHVITTGPNVSQGNLPRSAIRRQMKVLNKKYQSANIRFIVRDAPSSQIGNLHSHAFPIRMQRLSAERCIYYLVLCSRMRPNGPLSIIDMQLLVLHALTAEVLCVAACQRGLDEEQKLVQRTAGF